VVLTERITGLSLLRVLVSFPVLFCSLFVVRFSMLAVGFININPQWTFHLGEMGLNGINYRVASMGFIIVDVFSSSIYTPQQLPNTRARCGLINK